MIRAALIVTCGLAAIVVARSANNGRPAAAACRASGPVRHVAGAGSGLRQQDQLVYERRGSRQAMLQPEAIAQNERLDALEAKAR